MVNLISNEELHKMFHEFNLKYFHNKLPSTVTVEWSNRLTRSAGICYIKKKIIRLSTHYHSRYPQDVENTLLHEMIHLVAPGHGKEFRDQVERIKALGGNVSRYSKERAKIPEKFWAYICPTCSRQTIRAARLSRFKHYKCTKCNQRCYEYKGQKQEDGSIKII